jgi:hypothetical protein
MERVRRWATILFVVAGGCAGSRVSTPVDPGDLEGRIVQSIVLQDSTVVTFDTWETASPGRDKRARVEAAHVEGYVDGVFRRYALEEIRELKLAGHVAPRITAKGVIVTVVVAAMIWGALFLYVLSNIDID